MDRTRREPDPYLDWKVRIFFVNPFEGFGAQKQFAADQAAHDWVLAVCLLALTGSLLVPYVRARGESLGVAMKEEILPGAPVPTQRVGERVCARRLGVGRSGRGGLSGVARGAVGHTSAGERAPTSTQDTAGWVNGNWIAAARSAASFFSVHADTSTTMSMPGSVACRPGSCSQGATGGVHNSSGTACAGPSSGSSSAAWPSRPRPGWRPAARRWPSAS